MHAPDTKVRGAIAALVVVVSVLTGVLVGDALAGNVQTHTRVAMTWTVQFGELDPERLRIVESAGPAAAAATATQFPDIEIRYEIPPSKSFFDVRAVGRDRLLVARAANTAAQELIEADRLVEATRRDAGLGRIEPNFAEIAVEPYLEVIAAASVPDEPQVPVRLRSILGGFIFGLGLIGAAAVGTRPTQR